MSRRSPSLLCSGERASGTSSLPPAPLSTLLAGGVSGSSSSAMRATIARDWSFSRKLGLRDNLQRDRDSGGLDEDGSASALTETGLRLLFCASRRA